MNATGRLKEEGLGKLIMLRQILLSMGNIIPLRVHIPVWEVQKTISVFKEHFKPYSPQKKGYNRYGLSITSLDGGFSGVPDLDSLREYNQLNGTNFDEPDFRKQTPFFRDCKPLSEALLPFHNYMGRSHILRMDRGGFFLPHRDWSTASFRLFIPLCDGESYVFILDDRRVFFQQGQVYFINILLSHSLFSFRDDNLFVVFNIDLNREAVNAVFRNLSAY